MNNSPIPTPEAMREFLRACYRHDRFEVPGDSAWGEEFSRRMVCRHLEDLRTRGMSVISSHDSITGRPIWFGRRLDPTDGFGRLTGRLTGDSQ